MRLPITPQLSTKDGVSNKNARLTNVLKETRPTGNEVAIVRPGLIQIADATGTGRGLVSFDNVLISIYGATLNTHLPLSPVRNIGDFGGGISETLGVSGDGNLFCGYATNGASAARAFVGTPTTDIVDLGTFGGPQSKATHVSYDGNYVTGWMQNISGKSIPFRWSSGGGVENLLPSPPSMYNLLNISGISYDGSVIVGTWIYNSATARTVFRWEGGTFTDISTDAPATGNALAIGVSSDGSIVVFLKGTAVYQWKNGVITELSASDFTPNCVSSDGLVVGGYIDSVYQPAILTATGITLVPLPNGLNRGEVTSVSGDGSVVVGYGEYDGYNLHPFLWKSGTVVELLKNNRNIYCDTVLISKDGSTVVGNYHSNDYSIDPYNTTLWVNKISTSLIYPHDTTREIVPMCISENGGFIGGKQSLNGMFLQVDNIRSIATLSGSFFDFAQSPL